MLLMKSLALSLACSLAACTTAGPKVIIYVSNPKLGGMDTSEKSFVNYDKTDKFICLSPTDAQTLLSYCSAKGQSSGK